MTEKEMILHVLGRLKSATDAAIGIVSIDGIRDNENPHFSIPEPYTFRIGEFLITDEKTKLFGDIATSQCKKLTV